MGTLTMTAYVNDSKYEGYLAVIGSMFPEIQPVRYQCNCIRRKIASKRGHMFYCPSSI